MADLDALEDSVDTLEGEFVDIENRVIVLERKTQAQAQTIRELEDQLGSLANRITNWLAEEKIDERKGIGVAPALCANCRADLARVRPVQSSLSMLSAGTLRADSTVGQKKGD
jgi:hypothetical protein